MLFKSAKILILIIFVISAKFAFAGIVVSEIMYDVEGTDNGREWIEIYNNGNSDIDLINWKLYENETNHKINLVEESGVFILSAGSYAIIADKPEEFLVDWISYGGLIFDSTFSFKNEGEELILRDSELIDADKVSYSSELGAKGDGNSLQVVNGEWVAGTPTPGAENSVQSYSKEDETSGGEDNTVSQVQMDLQSHLNLPVGQPDGVNWSEELQIYANAGNDIVAVAGADVEFFGKALGLEKKPLTGARFLWSFGDGSAKEGERVKYHYKYPAEYIVVLNVSSGKYTASDRLKVKVIPNELKIVEANKDYIKLSNASPYELELTGWGLRVSNKTFRFPKSTIIGKGKELPVSSSISNLEIKEGDIIDVLYPNGSLSFSFTNFFEQKVSVASVKQVEKAEKAEKEKPKMITANKVVEKDIIIEPEIKIEPENIQANVISISQDEGWGIKGWVSLVSFIGILSAGMFFVSRKFA